VLSNAKADGKDYMNGKIYDVRRIANGLLVRTQSKDALLEKVERFKVWYCTDS